MLLAIRLDEVVGVVVGNRTASAAEFVSVEEKKFVEDVDRN